MRGLSRWGARGRVAPFATSMAAVNSAVVYTRGSPMKFLKKTSRTVAVCGAILGLGLLSTLAASTSLQAQETTLRIQTHFSAESLNGKNVAQFVKDVETMSAGRLKVEMFYSSSVVKSTEAFDAAANGVLDGDMTGGGDRSRPARMLRSSSWAISWAVIIHLGSNIPGCIMAAA